MEAKINSVKLKKATIIKYIYDLRNAKAINKFDEDMWRAMVETVAVVRDGKLEWTIKITEKVEI